MLGALLRPLLVFGGFLDPDLTAEVPRPPGAGPSAEPNPEPSPVPRALRIPTLSEACRRYQEAAVGWRLERIDPEEMARLRMAMGHDLYGWVRVQVLTGDRYTWRPTQGADPEGERAVVAREMRRDVARWERALVELDHLASAARRLGRPVPEPLDVPRDIRAAIEARRKAAEERAARRASGKIKAGAEDGGEAPEPAPPALQGPRR